jgi:diadenylate cyclase
MNKDEKEIQEQLVKEKKEIKKEDITDVLKIISPGTFLRNAIEGIQKAKTGGLIVVYSDFIDPIFEGGFRINCRFTSQKIIELSKMDCAIVLSKDLKKILYANVMLAPDNTINSKETGTRHKSAERTAKQAMTTVIAISQRRGEITLFHKNMKYVIRDTNDIIRRSTEILQILEKHREVFERNKRDLDREELRKKPRLVKALLLIQRGIIIIKVSKILKSYLIELGVEGVIVKSRLKEILYGIEKEVNGVIRDYSKLGLSKTKKILSILSYEELLELDNLRQSFGLQESEILSPKGYRILEKEGISDKEIGILIKTFKNLTAILGLSKDNLTNFFEQDKVEEILDKINHIKEQ